VSGKRILGTEKARIQKRGKTIGSFAQSHTQQIRFANPQYYYGAKAF
jgi:hypothetical protein